MSWFFISLIAPILWAGANHIDKYLLSKFVRGGGIGSLIIFSCLFSIIILPIILFIRPDVLDVSSVDIILLILVGILNTFGVLFYLYALNKDETSVVVPFFQLTPVFGFISAYFVLGEVISSKQLLATVLILVGAVLLSLEISTHKVRFKAAVLGFMLSSTILYGLHATIFKFVSNKEDLISSIFWEYVGFLLVGIIFFVFIGKYRAEFIKLITQNTLSVTGLNLFNESLILIGNMVTAFALTIAPVGLVLVIGGYQPFFVLLIGIILTMFFPNIEKENISPKYLIYKTLAIILIIYGGYLINFS